MDGVGVPGAGHWLHARTITWTSPLRGSALSSCSAAATSSPICSHAAHERTRGQLAVDAHGVQLLQDAAPNKQAVTVLQLRVAGGLGAPQKERLHRSGVSESHA